MTDLQFEKLKGIIRDWVICKKSIFKRFKLGMEGDSKWKQKIKKESTKSCSQNRNKVLTLPG